MAGDIQLTCSDCGQDFTFTAADQAFFQERGYSTPKRCKNCRQAKKNDQGGSGYRSAPAQGTPVICSGCGQPTTVPFEPRGDRPVFCRDCYQARKGSGGGGGEFTRPWPLLSVGSGFLIRHRARFSTQHCAKDSKQTSIWLRNASSSYEA